MHHGVRLDGAMDSEAMQAFCCEHNIRLLVDAAHPFASVLRQTIAKVSDMMQIPVVRYERIYPPRDSSIIWIDDYSQLPTDISSLLATTGVQSISKLQYLEGKGIKVYYRILNRESSIVLALRQGACEEQLCYYDNPSEIPMKVDAILLKESGMSGGFCEKVEAAKALGMKVIALKRPQLSNNNYQLSIVNGPYGLRRAVEKLFPEFYPLHSGLTTGTCATAAAVASTMQLLKNEMPDEVPVVLPNGETIFVPVSYGDGYASVIKEAGDDPDVTNGLEIRASAKSSKSFEIQGGEGVGTFTLPGFDYPPGSPAINKAPREMILQNIEPLSTGHSPLTITISVPDGEEIAKRTFNPRLGIEGGISIIGVSGIVKPFSEEAFIDSIRKCMIVAKASGADRVVINSGFKSEQYLKAFYSDLPEQAFVQYGNYIGETLRMAAELSIPNVTLGVMLGKAVKLAQGHLDTHSKRATMDLNFVHQLLDEANCPVNIDDITLARELWDRMPKEKREIFANTVIRHCAEHCNPLMPNGVLTILLIEDNGKIFKI